MKLLKSVISMIILFALSFNIIGCSGSDGAAGINGANGVTVNWQGPHPDETDRFASHGVAQINDAYYNTTDKISYIYNGISWDILSVDGTNGVSVNWQGTHPDEADRFASHGAAQINDAYYNTTDRKAYIYNGTGWDVFAQDPSSNLNVSGTIAPGNYLLLVHGLNRDDLTFNGQFVKNEYIYDYSEYEELFSNGLQRKTSPLIFANVSTYDITAAALPDSKVFIAYRDQVNSNYGTFIIVNSLGTITAGRTVFSFANTTPISVSSQLNGNVLIAYKDSGNSNYGTFVIVNSSGTIINGPTVFESAYSSNFVTQNFTDGNVMITYMDGGNSNYGTYVVINTNGEIIAGPTLYNNGAVPSESALLPNGNAVFLHGAAGYISIYNSSGTCISGPTFLNGAGGNYNNLVALPNGNILFAYCGGTGTYGRFVICNTAGTELVPSTIFENATANYISGCLMPDNDNNVIIAYSDAGDSNFGKFVIYNSWGVPLIGPTVFHGGAYLISTVTTSDGNIMFIYQSNNKGTLITYGINKILLQKVNSNEVRLYNNTDETLELMLSVDQ